MKEKIKKILFSESKSHFFIFLIISLFALIYWQISFGGLSMLIEAIGRNIEWNKLRTEDIIYIVTGLILAIVAIFREPLEQIFWKPELNISFANYPPCSHLTVMDFSAKDFISGRVRKVAKNVPVYYFSLLITNRGEKQARNCEVVLEQVSKKDKEGNWIKEKYIPSNLKWVVPNNPQFISINPGRSIYCNIGHILHPDHQHREPLEWRFMPEQDKGKPVLRLELRQRFYYQRDCFPPGEYKIQLAIYSENDRTRRRKFKIKWTGRWRDKEVEMLDKEIKIE